MSRLKELNMLIAGEQDAGRRKGSRTADVYNALQK